MRARLPPWHLSTGTASSSPTRLSRSSVSDDLMDPGRCLAAAQGRLFSARPSQSHRNLRSAHLPCEDAARAASARGGSPIRAAARRTGAEVSTRGEAESSTGVGAPRTRPRHARTTESTSGWHRSMPRRDRSRRWSRHLLAPPDVTERYLRAGGCAAGRGGTADHSSTWFRGCGQDGDERRVTVSTRRVDRADRPQRHAGKRPLRRVAPQCCPHPPQAC